MDPMMQGGLGLGAWGLGTGLNYMGQRAELKAMQEASDERISRERGFADAQWAIIGNELTRRQRSPLALAQTADATAAAMRGQRAVSQAAQAGGQALGLGAPAIARAVDSQTPAIQMRAHDTAGRAVAGRDSDAMQQASLGAGLLGAHRSMEQDLDPARQELAGMTGQTMRVGGKMMADYGLAALMDAMSKAKQPTMIPQHETAHGSMPAPASMPARAAMPARATLPGESGTGYSSTPISVTQGVGSGARWGSLFGAPGAAIGAGVGALNAAGSGQHNVSRTVNTFPSLYALGFR